MLKRNVCDDASELEVKDTSDGKTRSARQEDIKALRKLFEDFEAQLKWQEDVDQEDDSLSDPQEEHQ